MTPFCLEVSGLVYFLTGLNRIYGNVLFGFIMRQKKMKSPLSFANAVPSWVGRDSDEFWASVNPNSITISRNVFKQVSGSIGSFVAIVYSPFLLQLPLINPLNITFYSECGHINHIYLDVDSVTGLSLIHISEPTRLGMISY